MKVRGTKAWALVATAVAVLAASPASALAGAPLTVNTSVSPRFIYFADKITARVTVIADRRLVDPASLRVSAPVGDWEQITPMRTTSTSAGPFTRRSWSFELACLRIACLPGGKPLTVRLPASTVSAKRVDGSTLSVKRPWPAVSIAPRFGKAAPGSTPRFALDRQLPAVTYRVGPNALAYGLDAGALLLAAVALLIVVRLVLRRRRARAREVAPLARALAFVRQAKERPVDDRRRAAGLLARTLAAEREDPLSAAASNVAWSAGEPAPTGLEDLARSVEETRAREGAV